ncbi:MAG: SCO family protein [Bauldia sp.]
MRRPVRSIGLNLLVASVLLWLPPVGAVAHDLNEVQQEMLERDQYFQVKNEPVEDFNLKDADGNPVSLSSLRGKVVVLNFIYTNCPDVCPLHSEKIAEIQRMMSLSSMREDVQFVTVTTDPRRDTPDVLRAYGELHGLDPANWAFLTSSPESPEGTTRAIAERFGLEFTPDGDGMLMHGVATIVIDRDGRWRGTFHGLDFAPVDLVVFANALLNSDHPHGEVEGDGSPIPWRSAVIGLAFIGIALGAFLIARRRAQPRNSAET